MDGEPVPVPVTDGEADTETVPDSDAVADAENESLTEGVELFVLELTIEFVSAPVVDGEMDTVTESLADVDTVALIVPLRLPECDTDGDGLVDREKVPDAVPHAVDDGDRDRVLVTEPVADTVCVGDTVSDTDTVRHADAVYEELSVAEDETDLVDDGHPLADVDSERVIVGDFVDDPSGLAVAAALPVKDVVGVTVPVRLVDGVRERVGEPEKEPDTVLLGVRDPDRVAVPHAVDDAHAEKLTDAVGVGVSDCVSVAVTDAVIESVALPVRSALCDRVALDDAVPGALADAVAGSDFVAVPLAAETVGANVSDGVDVGVTEGDDECELLTTAVRLCEDDTVALRADDADLLCEKDTVALRADEADLLCEDDTVALRADEADLL